MTMQKDDLRKAIREKRSAMDANIREAKSERICEEAASLLFFESRHGDNESQGIPRMLALYSAMKAEADLTTLATRALDHGLRICYPAMIEGSDDGRRSHMEFFEVNRAQLANSADNFVGHQLRLYKTDELESTGFAHIDPSEIDAMAVPLVGFDDEHNRLGYGGGNYDRYLPCMRKDAVIFGIAFDEQRIDRVPVGEFDVPLPKIIHA